SLVFRVVPTNVVIAPAPGSATKSVSSRRSIGSGVSLHRMRCCRSVIEINPDFITTPQIWVPSPLVGEGQGEGTSATHRGDESEFVIILKGMGLVNVFLRHGKGERTFDRSQFWSLTFEHFPHGLHRCPGRNLADFLAPAQTFA